MIYEDNVDKILKFVFFTLIIIATIAVIGFVGACAHRVLYGSHPEPFVIIRENIVDGKSVRTTQKEYRQHAPGIYSVNCKQCNDPELRHANSPIDEIQRNKNQRNAATNVAIMSAGVALAANRR